MEVGVPAHMNLEAAVACADAADLIDTGVVALRLAGRQRTADARPTSAKAIHERQSRLHAMGCVVVGVLLAGDIEVATDISEHFVALGLCAADCVVVAT